MKEIPVVKYIRIKGFWTKASGITKGPLTQQE